MAALGGAMRETSKDAGSEVPMASTRAASTRTVVLSSSRFSQRTPTSSGDPSASSEEVTSPVTSSSGRASAGGAANGDLSASSAPRKSPVASRHGAHVATLRIATGRATRGGYLPKIFLKKPFFS